MAIPAWPDLSELAQGGPGSEEGRAALFRLQVDLFVGAAARDAETIRSFQAIALGFLPRLDAATAAQAARRLAPCPDTPAAVLDALIAGDAETRTIVAALAPSLSAKAIDTLLASPAGRLDLAVRADLAAATEARLLALYDPALDRTLAGNPSVAPGSEAFAVLLRRARDDAGTAAALLERFDLTLADEAALYLAADEGRRAGIRVRMAASALYRRAGFGPRADAALVRDLLRIAREGDIGAFEDRLGTGLGLPEGTSWRVLAEGRDDLLPLGLVALGVDEEDALRIALALHPAISHSVARMEAIGHLVRAVPRPIAQALVEAILQGALPGRTGRHDPVHDPAERPGLRPHPTRLPTEERGRKTG
jgi:hypothetical protein